MDDLISRQAAIEVAKSFWYKPDIAGELEKLPPIQPEPFWTLTEKDGELTAGDEVMWKDLEVNDSRGLALWVDHMVINGHRKCCIMCIDGSAGTWDTDEFTKTGRRFDINKILEAMRT